MKLWKKTVSILLAAGMMAAVPLQAYAAENSDDTKNLLPQQVVSTLGIASSTSVGETVTRGQFAQVLLNASSRKGKAENTGNYRLFSDVAENRTDAAAIAAAVQEGWMSGYVDGNFRPDQPVTLREALRGVLALLGYTNEDFTGDQMQGRIALYYSKNLDEGIALNMDDNLTRSACENLIYNLLKANTKQGNMYGQLFDCTLNSDDEIDYLALLDNHITGPIVVSKEIKKILPFKPEKGTFLIDGVVGSSSDVGTGDVLYYSSSTRTVWVYQDHVVSNGKVEGIVYDKSGSMTPIAVYIDGVEYALDSEELKLAFSTTGEVRVGDKITAVYDVSSTAGGEEVYTLKGYLFDD